MLTNVDSTKVYIKSFFGPQASQAAFASTCKGTGEKTRKIVWRKQEKA